MIKCKHMLAKIEIYFHLLNNEVSFHTIIVILQPGFYPYLACLLKAAIEIKIRVLSKDISKQFCLNRCRWQYLRTINKTGIRNLPFLRALLAIHQQSHEPSLQEALDSYFVSISKCCSFKNPLVTITSLSELYIVT